MEVAPKQSHCLKQNILVVMLLVKNLLRSSFFFYLNIKTSPDQEARNFGNICLNINFREYQVNNENRFKK